MSQQGWIGVDLDGTLAFYDHWRGAEHIGAPLTPMVQRVKGWLLAGLDVRIFTARVWSGATHSDGTKNDQGVVQQAIAQWCLTHIGQVLPITCVKDYLMIELWDDRAVQMVPNTGNTLASEFEAQRNALSGKAAYPEKEI